MFEYNYIRIQCIQIILMSNFSILPTLLTLLILNLKFARKLKLKMLFCRVLSHLFFHSLPRGFISSIICFLDIIIALLCTYCAHAPCAHLWLLSYLCFSSTYTNNNHNNYPCLHGSSSLFSRLAAFGELFLLYIIMYAWFEKKNKLWLV